VPATRTLTKGRSPIHLGARALDILIALVERASQVVSSAELFAIVWPKTSIEESALRVHIAALRKALGDGRSGPHLIVSVRGRGYCPRVGRLTIDERRKFAYHALGKEPPAWKRSAH
jgi:DNA-binding winged helix-turn-helix (wHTH) protein